MPEREVLKKKKKRRERGCVWGTHQIVRAADALIQPVDALSDLKVRSASFVQCVQARLFPEYARHVEDIAPEDDVAAQREEFARQPHRVAPRERQLARERERAWQSLRTRVLEDRVRLRFVVRQER